MIMSLIKHFENETLAFGQSSEKFHLYLPPFKKLVLLCVHQIFISYSQEFVEN